MNEFLVCVNDSSAVCGGIIGVGGKFCLKLKDECTTVKHEKTKFVEVQEGIYLKGSGTDAYCTPCVPAASLNEETKESLLS